MAMISDNILRLKSHIAQICQKIGRNPQDITIVGITKYSTVQETHEAVSAGITHIGESKVQQALLKYPALQGVTRHMVGHLQTNKAKSALEVFDIIQSVDSYRLAQELDRHSQALNRRTQIFIQVNMAGEEQKFGVAPQGVFDLLTQITELKSINVIGLMAMGPLTEDRDAIRDCFKKTKELYQEIAQRFARATNIKMKFLSMGMSDDYDIAIEEGANMVRIGSAIFMKDEEKAK